MRPRRALDVVAVGVVAFVAGLAAGAIFAAPDPAPPVVAELRELRADVVRAAVAAEDVARALRRSR